MTISIHTESWSDALRQIADKLERSEKVFTLVDASVPDLESMIHDLIELVRLDNCRSVTVDGGEYLCLTVEDGTRVRDLAYTLYSRVEEIQKGMK